MLDHELCVKFGVHPYMEWIQNKLDDLEDELYSGKLETETYLQVKAAYDALIEARNTYCDIAKGKTPNYEKKVIY